MTTETPDSSDEWARLVAVSSLADVVARDVNDFSPVPGKESPEWLAKLGLPAGWLLARLDGESVQPARIAVCNLPRDSGGGVGCETISACAFTGVPPLDAVRDNADCALRDLHAHGINTRDLPLPVPGSIALRSSGYFDTGGLQVWAQQSTYLAGRESARGLLILHSLFIEARCLTKLRGDIVDLSDAVYHAFLTTLSEHR
ncbi:hypothetical protein [Mycobacterium sp. pW045]|uniref:hypothetical protein n=1 Tax=Mycobacterium sp. pW045 TaxID=3238984 RepID=UPI00351ABB18